MRILLIPTSKHTRKPGRHRRANWRAVSKNWTRPRRDQGLVPTVLFFMWDYDHCKMVKPPQSWETWFVIGTIMSKTWDASSPLIKKYSGCHRDVIHAEFDAFTTSRQFEGLSFGLSGSMKSTITFNSSNSPQGQMVLSISGSNFLSAHQMS